MALQMTIEKLEDVDEALRSLYTEKGGKFHLDVDGLDTITTEAIKTATKKANKEAEQERLKRKEWERLGKTPEEIEEMLTEWDTLKEMREKHEMSEAEKKGQWEQLKTQMNDKHGKELRAKDDAIAAEAAKNDALTRKMYQHLIVSTATTAIANHRGMPELLLPHVMKHLKVVDEEGVFQVQVVDDKGEPIVNGKGDAITPTEFVGEMQTNEVFGRCFQGTGNTGGGSRPGGGGTPKGDPSITKRSDFKSERQRAEYIDKYGLPAYQALPMG